MVNVKIYNDGFIVSGHANYNKYNKDIVCAGISSIIIGSLNWFDEDIIELIQSDGYIKVKLNINNKTKLGLSFIRTQIESIYYNPNYKPYIKYELLNTLIQGEKNE